MGLVDRLKVLLIEDDDLDAKLVKYRLQEDSEHEYDLETVTTLESACGRIELGDIDVILADLSLPDSSDRISTLHILTSKALNIPIVVLTGYSDFSFELDSVRRGIQDYVVKDQVTRHLLVRAILHAVERHRLEQENKMLLDQLERVTLIDPLTELFNCRGLEKILPREIAWRKRHHSSLLALLVDLDNFKAVNDVLGHLRGDKILIKVGNEIANALRTTDYLFRIGGDDFILLLPETKFSDGLKVGKKICRAISAIQLGAGELKLTANIGLTEVEEPTTSVEEMIKNAHRSLQQAKQRN